MEISKQPIKTDLNLSTKIDSAIVSKNIITDIHNLKLEIGKTYTATVIQSKDSLPANVEQTLKSSSPPISNEVKNAETPPPKTIANNEWLISVKGKVALISSEKVLENGQKLLLKLEQSLSGEKPILIAQLINNKVLPTPQSSNQAFVQASNTLLQAPGTSQINQLTSSSTQALDNSNIKVLLQALNLTLDKQLPLQQGFQHINHFFNKSSLSPLTPENEKLIETIKNTLIDKLPKMSELITPTVESKNTPHKLIKQSLLESGIFLEKNLLSKPENLIAFKERLSSLDSLVTAANAARDKTAAAPTTTSTQTLTTNATTNKASAALQLNYGSAIQKIQHTIDSLLQLSTNRSSPAHSSKSTDTSSSVNNDLKANLISTSSLLIKQLSSALSEAELNSLFLAGSTDPVFTSPFAFPLLSASNTAATSKAIFDKQEFSTGQILKLLAGMIHKLQFNQLHSLLQSNNTSDNPLQQTWFFELPILNNNQNIQTFNFRIDKEAQEQAKGDDKKQAFQWKLLLSFDLDDLGPIYILVKLSQNNISSELWADKESTFSLLQKESLYFKDQLEKIGLNVGEVLCKKGQPNQTKTKLDRHLVDTKA